MVWLPEAQELRYHKMGSSSESELRPFSVSPVKRQHKLFAAGVKRGTAGPIGHASSLIAKSKREEWASAFKPEDRQALSPFR